MHGRARSSIIREQYANRAGAEVTLYGLTDAREIVVLGQNQLAGQVRAVLRGNQIPGWRLHDLPAEQTPVQALYARLSVRSTNILQRAPFVSAQEVAALPDEVLLEFRGLGPRGLAEIRSALADPSLGEFTIDLASPGTDTPDDPTEDLVARLRPEHRARYRDFLRDLATVGLPTAVFEKIVDSIGAEPVPAADPLVVDILVDVGTDDLLDHYLGTHDKASLETSGHPLP
nr:DNA-directed RNA polymerase subunit alpha C-terminal domain-containing protein [Micromonospora sp. DSM 115978]